MDTRRELGMQSKTELQKNYKLQKTSKTPLEIDEL